MILFEHPEVLYATPILVILFIIIKYVLGKKTYMKIHVVEHPLIDYVDEYSTSKNMKKWNKIMLDLLSLLALISILVALASPINQYTIVQQVETSKIGTLEIKVKPPVVLVLDNSGSMSGEKIEVAKKALLSFIEKIDHKLDVGLVVFNGVVDIAIPSTPNITRIKEIIPSINATDGTMYSYPLNIVYQWLKPYRDFNVPVFVVFASDGMPADPDQTLTILREYAKEHIPIYTIFIGKESEGYEFLKEMSKKTKGEALLAEQINELIEKFDLVADKIVKNVEANFTVKLTYNITKTIRDNLSIYFGFSSLLLIIACSFIRHKIYGITF